MEGKGKEEDEEGGKGEGQRGDREIETLAKPKTRRTQRTRGGQSRTSTRAARVGVRVEKTKVRTKPHFFRPKTLIKAREPKYRRALPRAVQKMDRFRTIRAPLTTESALQKIEDHNTLVFLCDPKANKRQIKKAVEKLYEIVCKKVNTLIRPDGQKKAYVKLTGDFDALDVANRIGVV